MTKPNNTFKRFIATILAFAMIITLIPAPVYAVSESEVEITIDDIENLHISDDTVFISGDIDIHSDDEEDIIETGAYYCHATDSNDDTNKSKGTHVEAYDRHDDGTPPSDVEEVEVTIDDLDSDTDYVVETYVKFMDGDSERIIYSDEKSFKTDDDDNNDDVTFSNLKVSYQSSDQAYASTDMVIKIDYDKVNSVGFVYSETDSTPEMSDSNSDYVDEEWSQHDTFNDYLTDLDLDDSYYVRAYVRTDDKYIYSDVVEYDHEEGSTSSGGNNNNNNNSNSDVVSTDNANYENLKIKASGTIDSSDLDDIDERGFVYSPSESSPTLSNATKEISKTDDDEEDFDATWSVDSSNSTYYVRAYATEDGDTDYGKTIKVDIGTDLPIVYTKSVSNVTLNGSTVTIDVSRAGKSSIIERGVVYSSSNSTPELYNTNTKYKSTSGTIGEATVTLDSLEPNTKYYVRAYARNNEGTSYGETLEFFTISGDSIKTLDPTLNGTSIMAKGSIKDFKESSIQEKGFVYSATDNTPSKDDMSVSTTTNTLGEYSLEVTGLSQETTYYISAYVKTDQGYAYGNVVTFTTSGQDVALVISYTDTNGAVVGTQQVATKIGSKVASNQLMLPAGYALVTYKDSYPVTGSTLSIPVNKIASAEKPFMEGVGGYKFAPEQATTRAEVAQIIYNLAENQTPGPTSKIFTDVPATHPAKSAIDYVSSKNYMAGYPDGSFKPDAPITRAEVCVVLTIVYSLQGQAYSSFTDVPNTLWSYQYISLAFNNKMIYGYPDGSFKPENNMTRAEVATLFSIADGRSLEPLGTQQFADVPTSHWAHKYIMNAAIPKP